MDLILLSKYHPSINRWDAEIRRASSMLCLHRCPSIAALLSFVLFHVIHCAPATSPLPSRPIYSLPPLQPSLPLNASSNGNCASTAKYPSWSSDDWVVEDCYTAVQQLYLKEVFGHPEVAHEFVARGLSPTRFPLGSERTPRKYVVRKLACALRCCSRKRQT